MPGFFMNDASSNLQFVLEYIHEDAYQYLIS